MEEAAGGELDLRGCDLRDADLGGCGRTSGQLVFGRSGDGVPAQLAGASFLGRTLTRCDFVGVDLTGVRFEDCTLVDCDLRRAVLTRTILRRSRLVLCDLHGAEVGVGTVFEGACFDRISPPSSFGHAPDLSWEAFTQVPAAFVAEDEEAYPGFLARTHMDRSERHDCDKALANRLADAAHAYRALAGQLLANGQVRDAGRAYVRAQRLERTRVRPGGGSFRPMAWLGLWLAGAVCEFGESLWRVVATLALVALLVAGALFAFDGLDRAGGVTDYLLFSVARLVATTPEGIRPTSRFVEWIAVFETMVGIALLGLFGFVLGNALRRH